MKFEIALLDQLKSDWYAQYINLIDLTWWSTGGYTEN